MRGAHSLFRLHQRRPADLRKGKRLGKNDRLMVWSKPWLWQRPRYLSKPIWQRIAQQLSVWVVRFTLAVPGYRSRSVTLVPALLDASAYRSRGLSRIDVRR